jgi:hypothetical protein
VPVHFKGISLGKVLVEAQAVHAQARQAQINRL